MFYGQFREDEYINNFFEENYIGICIDVGAYDGISGSNTFFFENKGWDCLCIEPVPESFINCKNIRKKCLNLCISDYDSDNINFNVVTVNETNKSAISSLKIDDRLIESHKNIINQIDTVKVNVRKLDTILNEIHFSNKIDFISIDTENTELDVLKGLTIEKYDIKFFIIENNFDENFIEEYLKTKNFIKINRLGVNDFYINVKYLNYFENKIKFNNNKTSLTKYFNSAYYHTVNNVNTNLDGCINNEILNIFKQYENNKINLLKLVDHVNDIDVLKKLFINFNMPNNTISIVEVNNNQFVNLDMLLIILNENILRIKKELYENKINKNKIIDSQLKMDENLILNINVSIGEIVDKYSILELKKKYILNQNKMNDIQNEMNIFEKYMTELKTTFFYKLLIYINEQIWLDTDKIKNTNIKNNINLFAELAHTIFENNQKRYRLKNYFNVMFSSNLKEHKSYVDTTCFINIKNEEEIYDKISEINFLFISYDLIYFNKKYENVIKQLFKNPNIIFLEDEMLNVNANIQLSDYIIDDNIRKVFEFDTIKYISGGKFGDYLNQLSVICENFYKTGQKGELYIANIGDFFSLGLEYTYNDTYNVIKSQKFIDTYKIYDDNDEEFNYINLSDWRTNVNNYVKLNYNWIDIYSNCYNISWGSRKWLNLNFEENTYWKNKIIINITPQRFISENATNKIKNIINDRLNNCIFISNERDSYEFFCNKTNLQIIYYKSNSFEETINIINSCELCFLGFSSMAVIANSLHKPHYLLASEFNNYEYILNNMKNNFNHVLDILF
jgi:FkbM family methyltransferase